MTDRTPEEEAARAEYIEHADEINEIARAPWLARRSQGTMADMHGRIADYLEAHFKLRSGATGRAEAPRTITRERLGVIARRLHDTGHLAPVEEAYVVDAFERAGVYPTTPADPARIVRALQSLADDITDVAGAVEKEFGL